MVQVTERSFQTMSEPQKEDERFLGWKVKKMNQFMKELYGTNEFIGEAAMWQELILYGMEPVADPINLPNIPDGIRFFAKLDGAMGRQFYIPTDKILRIPRNLTKEYVKFDYHPSSFPTNPFYTRLYLELSTMPFNADLKLKCDDEAKRLEMLKRADEMIKTNFSYYLESPRYDKHRSKVVAGEYEPIYSKDRMRTQFTLIRHSNGVEVAKYFLKGHDTNQMFTTDLTIWPNEKEQERDLRHSKILSSKQDLYAYLALDEEKNSIVCMAPHELVQKNVEILEGATSIEKPEYQSFEDAMIAGLQAIRLEQMWPTVGAHGYFGRMFDEHTREKYPLAVNGAFEEFKRTGEKPNEYRVKEIIRNAVVCATQEPDDFFHMLHALGILDCLFPELMKQFLNKPYESIDIEFFKHFKAHPDEFGPVLFAKFLKEKGFHSKETSDLGVFAEAFDIRRALT